MNTEYELRVLEINTEEIIKKLESLGAKKESEYNYRRYVFDIIPKTKGKWIRLRTDGETSTITYKNIIEETTIEGTKELEVVVEDFDKTNDILNLMGYKSKGYQENKRIRYILDNVEIDIDFWPLIPPYLEIEGSSEEEVLKILKKLEIKKEQTTFLGCDSIYKKVYNINLDEIEELKF